MKLICSQLPKVWPYTMHFASGLSARPAFVLAQPAVFELYGAGWTKQGSSKVRRAGYACDMS